MRRLFMILLTSVAAACAPGAQPAENGVDAANEAEAAALDNSADNMMANSSDAMTGMDSATSSNAAAGGSMEPTEARTKPDKPILINSM